MLAGYLRVRAAAAAGDLVVCRFRPGLSLVLQVLGQLGVRRVALQDWLWRRPREAPRYVRLFWPGASGRVPVDGLGVDVAALAASGPRWW
jgi:hypothetical protein